MPKVFELRGKRIWIAGHTGLVGSALCRALSSVNADIITVSHNQLDLCRQSDVEGWMQEYQPDVIILAAAKVGGIAANSVSPADFLYQNMAIAQNVIHQASRQKVERLVYLGSSCIYPKFAAQPISEDALLTGLLEPTNEAYAIAKIAGVKLCQFYRQQYGCDFISLMPCNLYGLGDHWDAHGGHVIPSLLTRIHHAKNSDQNEVSIWGTGAPLREFLYSDDVAGAVLLALEKYSDGTPLNVGSGQEISIADLAVLIKHVVGYSGRLIFDPSKPDGTPRKILNSDRLRALGWKPRVDLEDGLKLSYADFLGS